MQEAEAPCSRKKSSSRKKGGGCGRLCNVIFGPTPSTPRTLLILRNVSTLNRSCSRISHPSLPPSQSRPSRSPTWPSPSATPSPRTTSSSGPTPSPWRYVQVVEGGGKGGREGQCVGLCPCGRREKSSGSSSSPQHAFFSSTTLLHLIDLPLPPPRPSLPPQWGEEDPEVRGPIVATTRHQSQVLRKEGGREGGREGKGERRGFNSWRGSDCFSCHLFF